MNKILSIKQVTSEIKHLRKNGKKIVLAGGCFDILHNGHIAFLKMAKKQGDVLFVFLESDEKIRQLKGAGRPINSQPVRASLLSFLSSVDYVLPLPFFKDNLAYDRLVKKIKPDIIATTKGEAANIHIRRQAVAVNARVCEVTERIPNQSSSRFASSIPDKK